MGIHRQLPDRLRQLHPKFRTPWIGILLFGFLAILITLPGQADFLGNLYAFGAMLSFTIAHSAIIRLRINGRTCRGRTAAPGNWNFRGHDLPLFAFLGGFGTFSALVVTIALHPDVAVTGVVWLTLGVFVFMFYRRAQGLDLTSTHKVAIPQPVVDHEAEYDSVLVPLSEGYDEPVIATAAKLAARRRRGIHVLAIVTVPSALQIDAPMPEAVAAAESLIEQARLQAGARVSGHVERVRSGQAGRRIIEEATDMRAAAIVMPLPRRINGASMFGKTLETVLAERPCRVIIESSPADAPAPGADPVKLPARLHPAGADDPDRRRTYRDGRSLAVAARSPSGSSSACCSSPPGVGPHLRGARAAMKPLAEAPARLAGPVRDRPGLHRGVDLLLASASWRSGRSG